MYTPKHFEEKDPDKIFKFMEEYNFATVVSYAKKKPWASHLPFVLLKEGETITLKAHMAKANPQWASFNSDEEVLVIFHEPHSYISPKLYENKVSVPTWNYIAVHAYGKPRLLKTVEERIKILELSFEHFEPSYKEQWLTLPEAYKNDLLDGIMAFEIEVTKIEAKFKLSQNRTIGERKNVMESLDKSGDKVKTDIARHMRAKYGRK